MARGKCVYTHTECVAVIITAAAFVVVVGRSKCQLYVLQFIPRLPIGLESLNNKPDTLRGRFFGWLVVVV